MRAEPMPRKSCVHLCGDLADRKATCVSGDDGVGASIGRYLLEKRALDLEILRDGFDDPIAIAQQIEIVFEDCRP